LLYHLLQSFGGDGSFLGLFQFITFRAALATLFAFGFACFVGKPVIAALRRRDVSETEGKSDSARLNDLHRDKSRTPTMGGLIIVPAVVLPTLFLARLDNAYVLLALFVTLALAAVGFLDDRKKLRRTGGRGIGARTKFLLQILIAVIPAAVLWHLARASGDPDALRVDVPFVKGSGIDLGVGLGILYLVFVILTIVGSSNAVNLTDGLDGLAIGCTAFAATALAVVAYLGGRADMSEYFGVAHVPGGGEVAVFLGAVVGAGMGFLWFNCFPAEVFMGDTGSLPLGGVLGFAAVVLRQELLLFVVGGIFVLEALSVILQVVSFKTTGKRLFRIAPLHHHFQFAGWHETKVTVRFWIVAALLSLVTVATLRIG